MNRIKKEFLLFVVFCAVIVCASNRASARSTDADSRDVPSAPLPVAQDKSPSAREATWRSLPKDFLHDQKAIWWVFPAQLAKGHYWLPTLAVTGGTAGLIAADPHVMPYFQSHAQGLDDLNDTFDSSITTAEVAAVPVSFMIVGYARDNPYHVSTALLAGEAYANSAVVDLVIKAITRRVRPSDVPPGGSFHDTFFSSGKSPFKGSSFPSGHAAGVFSVATVVASRYQKHRWAPWAVYGFAAAIGYTITRYDVLRPR